GFMAGIKPFFGKLPAQFEGLHLPPVSMWLSPLILALLGIVFGCLPGLAGQLFTDQASNAVFGQDTQSHLKLWHGLNLVLLLSILTLVVGTVVYLTNKPSHSKLT